MCLYQGLEQKGVSFLDAFGISCCAEEIVEEIMNRGGTDMCPFEKAVLNTENPAEGYDILKETMKSLLGTP